MMWGCGFPCCCSGFGSSGFGCGSSWIWAIIVVVFILFFFSCDNRGNKDFC